jgi:hypothetical protein
MITEFFDNFISHAVHKTSPSREEYGTVQNSILVKATTLYDFYKRYAHVCGETPVPIRTFYQVARTYLYYDKYVCDHGTEFYYYVVFSDTNHVYNMLKTSITKRVAVEHPSRLQDLQTIIKAFN